MRKPRIGLYLMGTSRFCTIGEGTPAGNYRARKEHEAEALAEELGAAYDVITPGVIYTRNDARQAIARFVQEAPDMILAMYLSWTEDFTWNYFLRDMPPVPVLFAHCIREDPPKGDTHDENLFCHFLGCGGLVGTLQASGDNARYARPMMHAVMGIWRHLEDELAVFARAARARALLQEAQVGLLASYNEVMWSTYVDPYSVFMRVGPELRFLSVAELCDAIERVSVEETERVCCRLAEKYPVRPDVEADKFRASVRVTLALERLTRTYGLSMLALNDVDKLLFEKVGLRPGFYPADEETSAVIVPEGDLGAGLACLFLRLLSGQRVNMIEPFHIDPAADLFEGGHAGPNDYTQPDGQTQIARDIRFAKTAYRYAGAPFAWHVFSPGVKTMLHLSWRDGNFCLAVTLVESMETVPHLASYSHGVFRPVGQSCTSLFEKLLMLGVTQHYAITAGDFSREALQLGHLLGFACHRV